MLTEGSERRARLCSVAGDVVQRRVSEELGDGVDAGLLRPPESHGSIRGRAATTVVAKFDGESELGVARVAVAV
jgi:hypothetical protein